MADEKQFENEETKATKLAQWLTKTAVNGFSIPGVWKFQSADQIANTYLNDPKYKDNETRIKSLIRWHSWGNFGCGFVTGLGGFMTLPITIPADLTASWAIQARMVAAIAKIYGHDISDDRVQTAVLLTLIGQDIKEILKQAGIKFGEKITYKLIEKLPGAVLTKINQMVGFRLITKAGTKGIINLTKGIPLVGGVLAAQ